MRSANIGSISACILPLVLGACGPTYTYSADSVDATIIDERTGQPLPGVAVVAYWELHRGSFVGDSLPCGAANVEEAITDKEGKFHIPGWGPLKGHCDLRDGFPFLYSFKPGYVYGRVSNQMVTAKSVSISRSDWNGKTIKMKEFPNADLKDPNGYAFDFGGLNMELGFFTVEMPNECNWKKIPHMLRAIIQQQKAFNAAGNNLGSIASQLEQDGQDKLMQKIAPECGSPKKFVEELEK